MVYITLILALPAFFNDTNKMDRVKVALNNKGMTGGRLRDNA